MEKVMMPRLFWLMGIILQLQGSLATNCTKLPQSIAPEKCCDFPRYFREDAIEYCLSSVSAGQQCVYECIYEATELCRKRRCDVRKADDYAGWVNSDLGTDFKPVYKQAYRECMKAVSELDNSRFKDEKCDPQPELIEICVHNKMFTLCPAQYYHNEIAECVQEREFINNCLKS